MFNMNVGSTIVVLGLSMLLIGSLLAGTSIVIPVKNKSLIKKVRTLSILLMGFSVLVTVIGMSVYFA